MLPSNEESILTVKNLSKRFMDNLALDDIDFKLTKGEIHGLLGENGAGKSTFVKILAGVYRKDQGEIYILNEKVDINNPYDARELGLEFIHQDINLVQSFNVIENIFIGKQYPRNKLGLIKTKEMEKIAKIVLENLGMDIPLYENIRSLSVAQQCEVSIARALFQKVNILFMDEPTASLSEREKRKLLNTIYELKKRGTTILIISHDIDMVLNISDRVSVFRKGKRINTYSPKSLKKNQIIFDMIGRNIEERFPKSIRTKGEVCLSVSKLSGPHNKETSFKLHKGEILGLIGLVGSGRTELIHLIYGVEKEKKGCIYKDGKEIKIKVPSDAIKNGIFLIPEDKHSQGLIMNFNLSENITLPSLKNYSLSLGYIDSKRESNKTVKYIKELMIKTESLKNAVSTLSGGNQQKVVIAKAIDTNSDIYIFDEPTKGIDIQAKVEVYRIIQDLAKNGAGIIFISSEMAEVMAICDRYFVLSDGEIIKEYSHMEVDDKQIIKDMFEGLRVE